MKTLQQMADIRLQVAKEVKDSVVPSINNSIKEDMELISTTVEGGTAVIPATVMFADLRKFMSLVEENPPDQVVNQLNEYFSVMTRIIVEYGGILDKYMGDEIMAYFECQSPLEYSKAAYRAVCAGIKMIKTLDIINLKWQKRGWPALKSGIGINSGPVLKSNIGSILKKETTIIGDTVNVASRLQQLNRDYDADLLISAATYKLVIGEFPVQSLGELNIRGRRKPVEVYEVELESITDLNEEGEEILFASSPTSDR